MKKRHVESELWLHVMDASSLINIERTEGIRALNKRKGAMLVPELVAYEVAGDPRVSPSDPLRKWINENSQVVVDLVANEERFFYEIRKQQGIHDGEAAAMAVCLGRKLPLVIDESQVRATGKAKNHGIRTMSSKDFLKGKEPSS